MEKLLEIGAWRQLSLIVAPSLMVVGSIMFLLGLYDRIPEKTNTTWLLGVLLALAVVVVGMALEELTGRFESKVDGWLYPATRRRYKLWSAMTPKRMVDPDVYMHHFNMVWERYLDLTPPSAKSIRWIYYDSLVHRYKVTMTLGVSFAVSGVIWLLFGALAGHSSNAITPVLTTTQVVVIGFLLLAFAVLMLFVEVPSSAWVLHWHRTQILRHCRGSATARPPLAASPNSHAR